SGEKTGKNQQALQCGECGYAHAVQLKRYNNGHSCCGEKAGRYQLLTGWYHREAPGTALQSLFGTQIHMRVRR
ncbi:hypothetical protein, partial [Raoultella ornithinolytica]|uniref:hypothetical protein n=1 Tax=Raoultella ornithinolytica TaxID=54291 RepID=UPI001F35ADA3